MKNFDERQIIERGRAYKNGIIAILAAAALVSIAEYTLTFTIGNGRVYFTDSLGLISICTYSFLTVFALSALLKGSMFGITHITRSAFLFYIVFTAYYAKQFIALFFTHEETVLDGVYINSCTFSPVALLLFVVSASISIFHLIKSKRNNPNSICGYKASKYLDERQQSALSQAYFCTSVSVGSAMLTLFVADAVINISHYIATDGTIVFRIPASIYFIAMLCAGLTAFFITSEIKQINVLRSRFGAEKSTTFFILGVAALIVLTVIYAIFTNDLSIVSNKTLSLSFGILSAYACVIVCTIIHFVKHRKNDDIVS